MTALWLHPYFLILICVCLNTLAQVMMKRGLQSLGPLDITVWDFFPFVMKVLFNPLIIFGILSFVFSLIIWLSALSKLDLSQAYPMMSIGYILTALLGYFLLGEQLTATRIVGILIIMMGVFLVSRS